MELPGPRFMLGLGITVVTTLWLLAIWTRNTAVSLKFFQMGAVVAAWFVLITIDIYAFR